MDVKGEGITVRTASVCCSAWNSSFCTFGLWGDFNDALTNALVNTFLGDINNWGGVNYKSEGRGSEILSKKWASVNVRGLSTIPRSAAPKSVIPVSRSKENRIFSWKVNYRRNSRIIKERIKKRALCQVQSHLYHSTNNAGAESIKRLHWNVQKDIHHCSEGMVSQ